MLSKSLVSLFSLYGLSSAHFRVLAPEWRGDSFAEGASQWLFPCANVSETTDNSNRTQWPPTGGSLRLNVSHPWAFTYVNLGIGTNVSSFNISLVEGFNQTGKGEFCLKETGRSALEAGLQAAGLNATSVEGMQGSLQIIQISHSGASLYNCADITFNSSAPLLSDDECKNATGVGGVTIQNVDTPSQTGEQGSSQSTGAASALKPVVGSGLVAGLVAWGLL